MKRIRRSLTIGEKHRITLLRFWFLAVRRNERSESDLSVPFPRAFWAEPGLFPRGNLSDLAQTVRK